MIANYHTHTRWCRHGAGEIEDYIQEALRCGLQVLAITEHVPYRDNHDPRRMQWEEFPEYDAQLDMLIGKYRGRIEVRKGFECEYIPEFMGDYRRFREEFGYEIMILGQHVSKDRKIDNFAPKGEKELAIYADNVIEGLKTGFFTFLAHPDVALCGYEGSMEFALKQLERVFETCEALEIPVEINANGMRGGRRYPERRVWEMSRKYRLIYLISSDAHYVPDLCDQAGVAATERMAEELGISVTKMLP